MIDASTIKEHMDVIAADGTHVGIVDRIEDGNSVKLTRDSSNDGKHHFFPLDWVDHVDSHVHLTKDAEAFRKGLH